MRTSREADTATGTGVRWTALALSLTVAAVLAPAGSAQAATCNATNGTNLTAHLADVNCNPITLSPGVYTTSASLGFAVGRTVTVTGAGAGSTTLTRTGANQILSVQAGGVLEMSGVTVSGATDGAGIVLVDPNSAAVLTNVAVTGNTEPGNASAGVESYSDSTILDGAAVTVTDSVISNNSGNLAGGAMNLGDGVMRFNRVLFTGNASASSGGGYYGQGNGAEAEFKNVTFTGNRADGDGGAVYNGGNAATTTRLNNVTIAGNFADDDADNNGDGGGVSNVAGVLTASNSIIANNADESAGAEANDCDSDATNPLTRRGYNLIRNATGCTFGGLGDSATGYQTNVNPMLGALTTSASSAGVRPLLAGSPAINTGNPAAPGSDSLACDLLDQRTLPRGGAAGVCDLGAFEVQPSAPTLTPTTTTTPFDLAAAIKKCKKKYPKGKKRKKCIKRAKARATS